jgi:hypothetical protein
LVEIGQEDCGVKGTRPTPEVSTATKLGRCDEVAWWEASEAGRVYVCGNQDCLGKIDGNRNAGDTVACEDESSDIAWIVCCLGVAEDGAI